MDWKQALEFCKEKRVAKAIKAVYGSYPAECLPQGICDPMYIMNTIALNLGIGDGQGNFNLPPERRSEG